MADVRDALRTAAFRSGPGAEYNAVSNAVRQEASDAHVVFYEIVLPEADAGAWLRDVAVARFVRHLHSKRLAYESAEGVVVGVFDGDRFHLIQGPDFLAWYREYAGIDAEELRARMREWSSGGGAPKSGLPALLSAAPALREDD